MLRHDVTSGCMLQSVAITTAGALCFCYLDMCHLPCLHVCASSVRLVHLHSSISLHFGCRNVSPGRLQRCFESLEAQDWQEWGLTLIDDCSTDSSCFAYQGALLEFGCSNSLQKRVSLTWCAALPSAVWKFEGQLPCLVTKFVSSFPFTLSCSLLWTTVAS